MANIVSEYRVMLLALATLVGFGALLFFGGFAHAAEDLRDSDSPYGVLDFLAWDHDWNRQHYDTPEKIESAARLMKEAGIRFARIDFLWLDLEPEKGRFDFARQDRVVAALSKNGIRILGLLEYNPAWSEGPWNAPPDRELYVAYARAVVRHYKDRVKYWEVWNEPDLNTYWDPQDGMKSYTLLLKAAYPAIKAEDPTSVVLLGGLTNSAPLELRRIYRQGGKEYFDIVNFHPFANPLLPDAMQSVHGTYVSVLKVMQEFGDGDKPIWLTELGCPGLGDMSQARGWFGGSTPSEAEQAAWVKSVYQMPLQWKGVKKVFWAFFRDTSGFFQDDVDGFGLLRNDFSKKPAFEAYQDVAKTPRSQN